MKKGFDPEGKKEMVHRVNIIAGVSGAKENAFYLEQLPKSKKEVREALIEALHFEPQNAELLLNLIKTEKGRAKASAQWASGFMDSEEIRKYWKKTASAPKFLEDSDQQWASELLAENLLQLLDKWLEGSAADMDFEKLFAYSEALKGKMTEKYGRILDSLAALWEKMKDDPTVKKRKSGDNSRNALEAVEAAISDLMTEGLAKAAVCQPENVAVMAVEINKVFERYGESYLEEAFVASLFTEPAEVTFEKFSPYIKKREILPAKREQCKREAEQIMNTFISIEYSKERQAYLYGYSLGISWNGEYRGDDQAVLPHGLDLRWYPLIFQYEWKKDIAGHRYFGSDHYGGFDALVRSLFRVDTEELRTWYGDYYYQKVTNETPYIEWFDLLMECGWKNVTGILKQTILRNRSWTVYAVRMLPEKLGLTRTETIRELEAARAELQNEQKSRETVERLIEELKRGVAFGDLR